MSVVRARSRRSRSRGVDPVGTRGLIRPNESGLTDVFGVRPVGRRVQAIGRHGARAARQLDERAALPLNDRQKATLALVASNEDGATAGDVMAALAISRSSATGVLRALVLRDLIDYRSGRATLKSGDDRPMSLVQIKRHTGVIQRVPREDGEPVIELDLEPHQDIVSVKLLPLVDRVDRVTVDWRWSAWVASRLGEAVA